MAGLDRIMLGIFFHEFGVWMHGVSVGIFFGAILTVAALQYDLLGIISNYFARL